MSGTVQRTTAERILKRSGFACEVCGVPGGIVTEGDHIGADSFDAALRYGKESDAALKAYGLVRIRLTVEPTVPLDGVSEYADDDLHAICARCHDAKIARIRAGKERLCPQTIPMFEGEARL